MVNTIKFSQFTTMNQSDTLNTLVGSTSSMGGDNVQVKYPLTWSTATRPASPALGVLGYNTNSNNYEFWNGSAWVQFAAGGSGTVNVGVSNELAYYAANGSAVSGLTTQNNAIVKTDGTGSPILSTTAPTGLTIPQPIIDGFTNGSSAGAGVVGQVISSFIPYGSSVAIPNNTPTNITNIALTAGQWILNGNIFAVDPSNQMTAVSGWANTVSATQPDNSLVNGFNAGPTHSDFNVYSFNIVTLPINITIPATYYLSVIINSRSGSTNQACGNIFALRVR